MAKAKKNAESSGDWRPALEKFVGSPLSEKAAASLSERAVIALHIEGNEFFFRRKKGRNTLTQGESEGADVHFWVPLSTLRHLLAVAEKPETGIATLGIAIIEQILRSDSEQKIKFRLDSGFLTLWGKGYFSVLKAGGPEVASHLGRWGFDSLSKIKEVMKKIRAQ
jgi:hypothetical protein